MNRSSDPLVNDLTALDAAFARIRAATRRELCPGLAARQRRLAALETMLREQQAGFAAAIDADFGHRSRHETGLLELFPSLEGIRHARRHVRQWMRPRRRSVSLWFQPGRAEVRPLPLGCVGIVVPWNYPLYLALGPLVAAFAAGNRALVKMSECTPATSRFFAEVAGRYFASDELAVVEGDAAVAQAFVRLPFDHLLFTGSTAVGHQVMAAAAGNLTPVTLELGGKSPVLVSPDYPIAKAATRIMAGKCLNAGQTCIAPDYVLLPAAQTTEFIAACRRFVAAAYPDLARSPDYTTIINDRHFTRLSAYLDETTRLGGEIVTLADCPPDPERRLLPPVLVINATAAMAVMRDEIFGPILPVIPYATLDEALAFINDRPRPLALYLFDHDRKRVRDLLGRTIAGGVTVNDTILHIAQDDLPFGGVGASGLGHYHGHDGFLTLSKLMPVFHQSRINGMGLFAPPYGRLFERLLKVLLR